MRTHVIFAAVALLATGIPSVVASQPRLPAFFVRNDGQAPQDTRFILRQPGRSALFKDRGITIELPGGSIEARFVGAKAHPEIEGRKKLEGVANYFQGSDSSRWRNAVPLYEEVVYRDVWAGVETVYSTSSQCFKSEFRVAGGADPGAIRWSYGEKARVLIESDGSLLVRVGAETIREEAPEIYQEIMGKRISVSGAYRIGPHQVVSFELGHYDRSRELVIDPVIVFTSYLGGAGQDNALAVAADSDGNMIVAGWTTSAGFPVTGTGEQRVQGGGVDAFVAKFGGAGGHLIFCTYLGGSADDRAFGLALDAAGDVYLVGRTSSLNFPLVSAYQTSLHGEEDAFVTKLNAAGSRILYSTYLGGSDTDGANAVAVDAAGYLYVAGDTSSPDFPCVGGFKATNQGAQDAFAVKFTPTGNALVYGTYLGGIGADHATAIAVNANGNAYVTGSTYSPNFPVNLAVQPSSGGNQDAFVTELSIGGNALIFSTFLGGSGGTPGLPEEADALALDAAGNIYVAGTTSSSNFPTTASALQPVFGGGNQDAFLVQYAPSGQSIRYSSFLGGVGLDYVTGMATDPHGYLTLAGYTSSLDFPAIRSVQSTFKGVFDAFVTKFSFSGGTCSLINSTYLGGALADAATAVAIDSFGSALVVGGTLSRDFPMVSPANGLVSFQTANRGIANGFAAKLANPFTLAVVQQTPSGPLFGLDFSRDRLWDGQAYTGGYYLFGNPGDLPLLGDWNHSGTVKIGVFRNGLWILDSNGNGVLDGADRQFTFGQAGDLPVLGDWDGSGTLKAGLFRSGTWILDYSGHLQGTATGQLDKSFVFGTALDTPVTGNWTGTGPTKIGVFRGGFWILDADGDGALTPADPWYLFGQAGDTPIIGDWDGSGVSHPGIVRKGSWFLNYQWNNEPGALGSAGTELTFAFGGSGSIPLAGRNF